MNVLPLCDSYLERSDPLLSSSRGASTTFVAGHPFYKYIYFVILWEYSTACRTFWRGVSQDGDGLIYRIRCASKTVSMEAR